MRTIVWFLLATFWFVRSFLADGNTALLYLVLGTVCLVMCEQIQHNDKSKP